MTNKPEFQRSSNVPPLHIQPYQRYLPTAFDESLSILQKLNKVIYQLNALGELSNDIVKKWNDLMVWIMGEGLNEIVSEEIDKRIADGTFDSLIYKVVGDLTQLETDDKTDLVVAINEVFRIASQSKDDIGDMSLLETDNKDNLVEAINEIKNRNDINNEVIISLGEATGFGVISGFKVRQQNVLAQAVEIGDYVTPNIVHLPSGDRHVVPSLALPVLPSDSVLDRMDIVYVNGNGQVVYTSGDLAVNPVPPVLPDNSVLLAYLSILHTDTTVNDIDIIDMRPMKTLNALNTFHKDNLVEAINEVYENVSDVAQNYATKQELINAINNLKNDVDSRIGDLVNLETTDKTDLVSAINEVINTTQNDLDTLRNKVSNEIGELSDLDTVDKSNLVIAINEIIANTYQQLADLKQTVDTDIGDLTQLKTIVKDNLVEAINENVDNITTLTNNIGDISQLNTIDKTSVVGAINELKTVVDNSGTSISVRSFGAVGDGVTDDSVAFQNWLNYLVENSASGFIPNGEYLIKSGGITYRTPNNNKWTITGESVKNTVLSFDYTVSNHLDIRFCSNFSLENFTIKCSGLDPQAHGVGLYMVSVNNVSVKNIDITNCSRCGVNVYDADFLTGGYCDNLQFDNVNIYGVKNSQPFGQGDNRQLYPMGWILTDCVNTTVRDSTIKDIAWYGFEFKNYIKNSYFIDCNAYNCTTACHVGGELRAGDNYGASKSGYINITCYDVDTPIVGGSFHDFIFDNIIAYYSDEFQFKAGGPQYCIRIQNAFNVFVRASLFNIPYGGAYLSDNCYANTIVFDFLSEKPNFVGREMYTVNSNNNTFIFKSHPIGLILNRNLARVGENIMIDEMMGLYVNYTTQNKQYNYGGVQSPNNSQYNYSGENLVTSYFSNDNKPLFLYGSASESYIRADYDIAAKRIQFRFYDKTANTTQVVNLNADGTIS